MNNVDKWFGPLASIIITAATAILTVYIGDKVGEGVFPWWPYPAFALLVATIFLCYGLLSREPSEI